MGKQSGEIYRKGKYSIWMTLFGRVYYVYEDDNANPLFETLDYDLAVKYIEDKLS